MKTPILETDRLILRPVALDDAPAIQKYFNNWNIIRHLSTLVPWPYPEDGALSYLKNTVLPAMEKGLNHTRALTIKGDNELIGLIGFEVDDRPVNGNRGFWLAEHLHGMGYMSEAIAAVNDYVFDVLKIEFFLVGNAKSNKRSRRVKEKTGAEFLKIISLMHHNGESETELWKVTRENWQKVRRTRSKYSQK